MSEPEPTSAAQRDLQGPDAPAVPEGAPSPGLAADADQDPQSAPPPTEAPTEDLGLVAGERLGAPFDATRVIADYGRPRPSYVFLLLLSVVTLALDIATKSWAEHHLDGYPGTVEVWKNHLTLLLAKNRGGAWGLLQSTSENVRRPFFLLVSVAAIAFIMTLYRRLQARQNALRWGLPLVLGGALGNVFDRVRYGHVIDFVDFHILYKGIDRHWPTFNVADIAICLGVGLMALDMFTSKRARPPLHPGYTAPAQSGEVSPVFGDRNVSYEVSHESNPGAEPLVPPAELPPSPEEPGPPLVITPPAAVEPPKE